MIITKATYAANGVKMKFLKVAVHVPFCPAEIASDRKSVLLKGVPVTVPTVLPSRLKLWPVPFNVALSVCSDLIATLPL